MRRRETEVRLTAEQMAAADLGVKAMVPVGRPFLDYLLASLADAGLTEICLVIGPEHQEIRRRYQSEARPTRFALEFAVQAEARGTADAVLTVEGWTKASPFIVVNSDNIYPTGALTALRTLGEPGLIGFDPVELGRLGNIEPARISRFALAWTDRDGYLTRIVEKPGLETVEPGALVSMNCWRFGPAIFEACRSIGPSPRGELEIQDAVRFAMSHLDERFRVVPYAAGVLDLSSRADVAPVASFLAGVVVRL
jgi:glucose-1-phosphate thymidylyltransferase